MKLETVASGIGQSAFALLNNGKKLASFVFNFSSNAARIEFANERRVFLFRREGFFKRKTVVCNEYGVPVGRTGYENRQSFIVVNDERYFYELSDKREPELTIYKDSKDQPLAVCSLDLAQARQMAGNSRNISSDKLQYGLLMALCLYLFSPAGAESRAAFAL